MAITLKKVNSDIFPFKIEIAGTQLFLTSEELSLLNQQLREHFYKMDVLNRLGENNLLAYTPDGVVEEVRDQYMDALDNSGEWSYLDWAMAEVGDMEAISWEKEVRDNFFGEPYMDEYNQDNTWVYFDCKVDPFTHEICELWDVSRCHKCEIQVNIIDGKVNEVLFADLDNEGDPQTTSIHSMVFAQDALNFLKKESA